MSDRVFVMRATHKVTGQEKAVRFRDGEGMWAAIEIGGQYRDAQVFEVLADGRPGCARRCPEGPHVHEPTETIQ